MSCESTSFLWMSLVLSRRFLEFTPCLCCAGPFRSVISEEIPTCCVEVSTSNDSWYLVVEIFIGEEYVELHGLQQRYYGNISNSSMRYCRDISPVALWNDNNSVWYLHILIGWPPSTASITAAIYIKVSLHDGTNMLKAHFAVYVAMVESGHVRYIRPSPAQ